MERFFLVLIFQNILHNDLNFLAFDLKELNFQFLKYLKC